MYLSAKPSVSFNAKALTSRNSIRAAEPSVDLRWRTVGRISKGTCSDAVWMHSKPAMVRRLWGRLVVLLATRVGVGGVPVACRSPGAGMVQMGEECFRWRRLTVAIRLDGVAGACADEATTGIPQGGVPARLQGFTSFQEIDRFFVASSVTLLAMKVVCSRYPADSLCGDGPSAWNAHQCWSRCPASECDGSLLLGSTLQHRSSAAHLFGFPPRLHFRRRP